MDKYSWTFEKNAERYYESAYTIEDCIKQAKEDADFKDYTGIYIGKNVAFVPLVDVSIIFDDIEDQAYDAVGEIAEVWELYRDTNSEQRQELENQFTKVLIDWLDKNKLNPSVYALEDIKFYSLESEE